MPKLYQTMMQSGLILCAYSRRDSIAPQVGKEFEDAMTVLAHLESRTIQRKFVPISELRDVLRRAAALLCRSKTDECTIVRHLVSYTIHAVHQAVRQIGHLIMARCHQ